MDTKRLQANVWKLYALQALRGFMLMMPIMVLFLQDNGLSMFEVFVSQAVFSVVALVLEIPSGYFADRYGMRYSLIIGAITAWLGVSVYALSFTFATVLFAEVLLGISLAFISGSDSALLYETLEALDQKEAYKNKESVLVSVSAFSEGIASLIGGVLALASLRTPIFVQAVVLTAMIPIAFSLYEPAAMRTKKIILASGAALSTMWRTFVHTLHTNKVLKWLILFAAVIDTATLTSVWFRQPYFELIALPLAWFGVVWAGYMFVVSIAAQGSSWYEQSLGKKNACIVLLITAVVLYILLGTLASFWGVVAFGVFSIIRGFKEPLLREYVQTLTDSSVRATVLSIKGFVSRVLFVFVGPVFGYVSDVYTLQTALLSAGVVFAALGAIALVQLTRYRAFVV